jgi:hypothetical protein
VPGNRTGAGTSPSAYGAPGTSYLRFPSSHSTTTVSSFIAAKTGPRLVTRDHVVMSAAVAGPKARR